MKNRSGLVLHIPHSSTHIPNSMRPTLLLSDADLQQELLRITDAYTDELFQCEGAVTVRYPVSRLVVDPERFEEDSEELMSRVGMGVIYTKTIDGNPLRKPPTPAERDALLATYYRPHHQALTDAISAALRERGQCLIIDCHSFPCRPLPYELDQDSRRSDVCVGTDEFHSPPELVEALVNGFTKAGYSLALNRPFAGALVPSLFYHRDANVHSVMIELNRALYMDETTGERARYFVRLQDELTKVLQQSRIYE